jgi:mannose-6-phosphate isomerase-like protein (cupin superfamily)
MRLSSIIVLLFSSLGIVGTQAVSPQNSPAPRIVSHDVPDKGYLPLLAGPLETVTMRSGRVILNPGKSVGKHSTDEYEEILVILEGQGEMRITGGKTLKLNNSVVAYCPPHSEHDVFNTGEENLRYIYIVAKAR